MNTIQTNAIWKENRNIYAKLLFNAIKIGILHEEPFSKNPPEGDLEKITKYSLKN